jgi:transposase InsO family protein
LGDFSFDGVVPSAGSVIMKRCSVKSRDLAAENAELRGALRRVHRELERVQGEHEILSEAAAGLIHAAPARDRFAFIHELRERFSIRRLCRVLVTDRRNYRLWARSQEAHAERKTMERELLQRITEIHTARPAYGAERVTRELKRQGIQIGRRRVARIMRENGLAGITRRKRRNLTKADQTAAAVPDLIQRRFTAPMPGLKLTGDITCFPTDQGWLYLATVLDLGSKELIGYAIAPHMRAGLVVDAITAAHGTGLVAGNAIMHTDRGSTTRRATATPCADSTSAPAPAEPAPASTARLRSPSSPPSRARSAATAGPIAPPRLGTSRTGSRSTTSEGFTPPSTTRLPSKSALPGSTGSTSPHSCDQGKCDRWR